MATGEKDLFLEIWEERAHVSQISGKHLGDTPRAHYFAHILGKGAYPGFRLRKDNIVLMTIEEHSIFDHSGKSKDDSRFDWVHERADRLRQEYNKRFYMTASGYHVDSDTKKVYSAKTGNAAY